jgi:hypothetical protein
VVTSGQANLKMYFLFSGCSVDQRRTLFKRVQDLTQRFLAKHGFGDRLAAYLYIVSNFHAEVLEGRTLWTNEDPEPLKLRGGAAASVRIWHFSRGSTVARMM